MCLLAFALDFHPDYKLVVAANRDEYYARPSAAAAFWEDHTDILAGRDLLGGGTWLGVTKSGRFAALTNYRDPMSNKSGSPSRGTLVSNFLRGDADAESYMRSMESLGGAYNGFNLLSGSANGLFYYSNRGKGVSRIEKGVHCLSNSLLDVPWPKVEKMKDRLRKTLSEAAPDVSGIFEILADRERAPDSELPQTGVSLEFERLLSPVFIKSPDYGTCSSAVVLFGRDGHVEFWERSFSPDAEGATGERHYEF